MKGIILAGGAGTRLHPLTKVISKQLLPIYDKPMIYYPLATLMLAGIKDILVISTDADTPKFEKLLGDGSDFGVNISYEVQKSPDGLVQAFLIGENFIGEGTCALVLGDNLFYGSELKEKLQKAVENAESGFATIFGYYVDDPERFGIVEFDEQGNVISVEEKPEQPKSNYCITGLYFYDNRVVEMAKKVRPSKRDELEITDLNRLYLENDSLKAQKLESEVNWFDMGTMNSLLEAANFVQAVQKERNIIISTPEEIAYNEGWITKEQLQAVAEKYGNSPYGKYLFRVLETN